MIIHIVNSSSFPLGLILVSVQIDSRITNCIIRKQFKKNSPAERFQQRSF